ncbi:Ataxin 2, SM domain protein [Kalmanozyma brasiliensis GHG001]|uniref:LsmAD domain-containing protein n=1 Tax=Kalmanozyma brasiliensis (strain GHG001) TaxID=1365824 RepID=V5EKU9_KALBG|nr:Ataxin 2, SM domain protein [Kalmanozyma brasiliensis GHG001]EST05555.1 Ataxin 2, SM domain protein [Kalmanozyma brasiliensis GHG001]
MASNGSNRGGGGGGGRGASNSGFRGNHAGGRGGGTAANRGGAGAPPQASRWGNGPPSANHNSASTNNSASHGQQNHAKGNNQRNATPNANKVSTANSTAAPTPAFPSLGVSSTQDDSQKLMHDRITFLLVTLVGNPVTVTVKNGYKFFGIFSAANTEGGELSVALASAQQILPAKDKDAQPELGEFKATLLINYKDLETIEAAEVRMQEQAKEMREAREKEAFRTDTEISRPFDPLASGRTLQKWADDPDLDDLDNLSSNKLPAWASPNDAGAGLEDTSNSNAGKAWDQFAANEARFGIKSNYEENLYTTKLDRSGKDFRNREREADRIAREIMGQATNNPHLAEERGQADDSGVNEEDKYGAVVRSPNAYVPPALRKQMAAAGGAAGGSGGKKVPAPTTASPAPSQAPATPKANGAARLTAALNANASAAAPPASTETTTAAPLSVAANPPVVHVKVPSPSVPQEAQITDASGKKSSVDAANPLMGDFRSFVSSERERLEKKKAALAKKEKDTRLADLKSWASTFKLTTPVPSDVAGMVQKDKDDGASDKPRDPSLQKSLSPTPAHSTATPTSKGDVSRSSAVSRAAQASASNVVSPSGGSGSAQVNSDAQKLADSKAMLQKMTIPKIPPFNPDKFKARQAAAVAGPTTDTASGAPATKTEGGMPSSVSTSSFKLSAKASSFKPFNPNAASFTPGGASSTFTPASAAAGAPAGSAAGAAAVSPAQTTAAAVPSTSARPSLTSTPQAASTSAAASANPFFGNRVIKKSDNVHIREDFNPFKVSKVPDAKSVGPMWAFSGKPYRQHFVAPPAGGAMDDGTGLFVPAHAGVMQPGMHPGAQTPQPVPQPLHPGQMPMSAPQGGMVGAPGPGPAGPGPQQQPFGMVYQPYGGGPYQYPGGQPQQGGMPHGRQPSMVQAMPMAPSMQGGPVPYGAMPQQFMGQMPFSPPMHQHGAPQNMYSPQMGNVPPSAGQQQFMPMPPPPGAAGAGPRPPPPHLQQKGPPPPQAGQPPHMGYYPGPGMQFAGGPGPHFGGPQGPPRQGAPAESGPASSAASSTA